MMSRKTTDDHQNDKIDDLEKKVREFETWQKALKLTGYILGAIGALIAGVLSAAAAIKQLWS